jgi:hypothetical protein
VFVVRTSGRAVIAYGSAAASDALSSSSTLGASPEFAAAARSVGGRPGLFLTVAPILDLVRSTSSGRSSSFQRAEPYLARFSYVAAGSLSPSVTRIVLGLR